MANIYVYSAAGGGATGADWANAYTTLAAALTAGSAGDTFWVAHDHAESQASAMTITMKGSSASPCRIICALRTGTVPPVSADLRTTATITTTGNNNMTIQGSAVFYCEGITFTYGSGAVSATMTIANNEMRGYFKNCNFVKGGTVASATFLTWGNGRSVLVFDNCTVTFGADSDAFSCGGDVYWLNSTAFAGVAASGNGIFGGEVNGSYTNVYLEGVDMSAVTSGKLFRSSGFNSKWRFKDCKLNGSVSFAIDAVATLSQQFDFIRCDSGDTNYRTERHTYQAVLTTETTTVRTGGASDGTTPIAWKIDPTANNERLFPFECFPITVWNDTTGSRTITIEGTWAGGAVPTTVDIWMDVEYLGTSGFPLGSFSAGVADSLATGTAHTASSETWGAGGTTRFKMAKTVTVNEKGPITAYIKYANVTNNCWIDPKITLS
jgi:hypothetical protein